LKAIYLIGVKIKLNKSSETLGSSSLLLYSSVKIPVTESKLCNHSLALVSSSDETKKRIEA